GGRAVGDRAGGGRDRHVYQPVEPGRRGERLQGGGDGGGLRAVGRVLRQHPVQDGDQPRREGGVGAPRVRGRGALVGLHLRPRGRELRGGERRPSGQHVEQHAAQGVHV